MPPIYLGVDMAGASNTWVAALSASGDGLAVVHGPQLDSLKAIVGYCESNDVVAVAIDAQLTAALSEENGFRTSDMELQCMLRRRGGSPNWVVSASGLLAVPVRGRLIAERLSPVVGTLIETHPRASLLFGLGEQFLPQIRRRDEDDIRLLWQYWSERFGITYDEPICTDGALDSLVCATVAYNFHHAPETLHKLRHEALGKVGRGPFYVVTPMGSPARRSGSAPT